MAQGRTLQVTLSEEELAFVRSKVEDGHFSSGAELVTHGISLLREEDSELDGWLKSVIAARYDEHKANPGSAIPIERVEQELAERRKTRAG